MKPDWFKKLLPHVIAIGVLLLLAVLYCKPVLDGKVLSQNDNIQWQAMAKQSLDYKATHGHTPLWTNRMFGGMPAYQIALESTTPFSIASFNGLFTLWLPKPINFLFLAALGFYFLCCVLRVRPWIGVLGAIAYAYSTYDPVIIGAGHDTKMMAMSYVPAVLAGILLLTQKKYLQGLAATTLFMSLLIAMNHLQVTYYFFLLLGVMGIAFLVVCILNKDYKHLAITAVLAIASLGISLGVNSMNLWTTYEYAKESIRGGKSELSKNAEATKSGGLDKEYAFRWSYGVLETFTFILPNLYGGSSQAPLSTSSKTYETLKELKVPDQQAEQMIKAWPLYWGDQPGTSGPVYLGIITCLLALLGFLMNDSWHKWWLLAITWIAIIMSWGSNVKEVNYLLFDYLPYYNKFRAPSMILIIPQLTFAIFAVLGLQTLIENKTKKVLSEQLKLAGMITGGLLVLLLLVSLVLPFSTAHDEGVKAQFAQMAGGDNTVAASLMSALSADRASLYRMDIFRAFLLAGLAYFLIVYYLKGKLKLQWLAGSLIVLMLFDLLQVDSRYLNSDSYVEQQQYNQEFSQSPVDQQILQDPEPYFRVFNLTRDPFNDAMTSYYHNSVGGYHAAKLTLYQDLIEHQLSNNNLHVLNMLNARYVIIPGENRQPVVQRNPDALGNAWFVKSILWVPNADAEMNALNTLNTKDTVVIDQRYKSAVTGEPQFDSTATIKLIKNDVDAISYSSTSATPQFAVFSEVYYKEGWMAFIDGKPVEYARVDYVLRGLSVPAGTHTIEFKFEPRSYFLGEKISFASTLIVIALLILAGVMAFLKSRKKG
jgi:hypothetical protein